MNINDQTPRSPTAGKMRANTRSRPTSQHGAQGMYAPKAISHAPRKTFNCIVDDTALVAGVKKSTRNGIRHWVKNGQIRLFVPLHALDQLRRQKGANTKHGEDVRETLQWLDDATTKCPHAVTLQGGDQYYANWAEVERFAVPRTLFSENDHFEDAEGQAESQALSGATEAKLVITEKHRSSVSSAASLGFGSASPASSVQSARSSISAVSPPTSPTKVISSPAQPVATITSGAQPVASSAIESVPQKLQPLFNFILWRIHQEVDPVAALESFIFLCNDPTKVHHAKGFDIRFKRLEQLREAVGREDRDYRNRMSMHKRENEQSATATAVTAALAPQDGDDEVVFRPHSRGAAAVATAQPTNLIDPNAFVRTPQPEQSAVLPPKSPRFHNAQPFGQQGLGGAGAPFSPRGNGLRGNFRGGQRGRGNFAPGRGGLVPTKPATNEIPPSTQIDPNSFERPRGGGGHAGRGGRKLWVPT